MMSLVQKNSATFSIARCGAEPTDRRPQLHVSIAGLAAVLLGGATWRSLATSGLVRATIRWRLTSPIGCSR